MNRSLGMILIAAFYAIIWYILIYIVEVMLAGWPRGLSIVTWFGLILVWPILLTFWVPLLIIEIFFLILPKRHESKTW
jgi:hypothetical protein